MKRNCEECFNETADFIINSLVRNGIRANPFLAVEKEIKGYLIKRFKEVTHGKQTATESKPNQFAFANQKEATGADADGFAIFPNAPAGWRAAVAQIELDQGRGLTLEKFIFKFAPPTKTTQ